MEAGEREELEAAQARAPRPREPLSSSFKKAGHVRRGAHREGGRPASFLPPLHTSLAPLTMSDNEDLGGGGAECVACASQVLHGGTA
jgi:hypothetical protein